MKKKLKFFLVRDEGAKGKTRGTVSVNKNNYLKFLKSVECKLRKLKQKNIYHNVNVN